MLRSISSIASLFLLFSIAVLADVQFNLPTPGLSIPNTAVTVLWVDDASEPPALSTLGTWTLFLMIGGDVDDGVTSKSLMQIAGTHTATGFSEKLQIVANIGPQATNAYYFKIISNPLSGTGTVINFSSRFTLTGMTGAWPDTAIQNAATQFAGDVTAVPPRVDTIGNAANPAPAASSSPLNPASYAVPYSLQSGALKYAPMAIQPQTVITASITTPQYPTSSWQIATTFLPPGTVTNTVTLPPNFSTISRVNTAAEASLPTPDAMQRFLERWQD